MSGSRLCIFKLGEGDAKLSPELFTQRNGKSIRKSFGVDFI